jgi:hypothetical protein
MGLAAIEPLITVAFSEDPPLIVFHFLLTAHLHISPQIVLLEVRDAVFSFIS